MTVRLKYAVDRGAGSSVTLRQLRQALTQLTIPQDGGAIQVQWFAPDMPTFEFCPTRAAPN